MNKMKILKINLIKKLIIKLNNLLFNKKFIVQLKNIQFIRNNFYKIKSKYQKLIKIFLLNKYKYKKITLKLIFLN